MPRDICTLLMDVFFLGTIARLRSTRKEAGSYFEPAHDMLVLIASAKPWLFVQINYGCK